MSTYGFLVILELVKAPHRGLQCALFFGLSDKKENIDHNVFAFYLWSSHHFQTHFRDGDGGRADNCCSKYNLVTLSISLLRQSALGSNIDAKEPTENTQFFLELNFAWGRRQ